MPTSDAHLYPIQSCIVSDVGRPRRRREATVERLLDAALSAFAEQGFAAASVEDICSRGGFTRGAFYSSFRTKDELFAALFDREVRRELARLEELLTGLADEPDPVAAAVERCLGAFRRDRTWTLVNTEYALHAARHPEAAALLHRHRAGLHAQLTALIDRAAADAGVQLVLPAGQLARTVSALHDGLTLLQVSQPDDDEVAELERPALLLLLRAAVTSPAPATHLPES
ncbi:MAG: transcriptional regulator, TetR family [Modestobacter sp.]|jgi:AcrR family transcriptional regulator|nr:transcriptional regulator, TetR family [Modestobacter sp.]